MHHRDGSGLIRKTTTLTSGRGSRDWTNLVDSRRSGILVFGSSRTPTVSYRALTTGRLTTSRQSATEVLSAGAGGGDPNPSRSSWPTRPGGSSARQGTRQISRASAPHRLHG